jgi:uncharacterized oligopeptide transporter (OPT) family protein
VWKYFDATGFKLLMFR